MIFIFTLYYICIHYIYKRLNNAVESLSDKIKTVVPIAKEISYSSVSNQAVSTAPAKAEMVSAITGEIKEREK